MRKVHKVKEEDIQYAIDKINYWYKKNIKLLSIITSPFNTSCIFGNVIKNICEEGGKVLYVWGDFYENRELINYLKSKEYKISYSNVREGSTDTDLTFVHYKNINHIEGQYDLIIFDDITCFSNLTDVLVREIVDICADMCHRIILYSIEKNSFIGEKFEFAAYDYDKPFLEPRVITTRIDLQKDIPYSVYDYIKWFAAEKQKIAVCVSDQEKIDGVYEYFQNKLKLKDAKIIKAYTNDEIKRCEKVSIIKDKAIFIITSKMEELLKYCYINNVIILFSDDHIRFDYKKIIYICGAIREMNSDISEVLLVCNEESPNIEKAKKIARNFNKRVWEKKLREL